MESRSQQQLRPGTDLRMSLPTELVIHVFCWLSTFSDVFNLAATCRRHQQIWTDNATFIYNHVAPRTIECRCHARDLLADRGGAAADSPVLSVRDVRRLVRNSRIVEKSIAQFNKNIVCHVRNHYCFYGPQGRPPFLTATERLRFIRSYYQLWGLMILDPDARRQRLDNMLLKHLYTVHEIAIPDDFMIGDETIPPAAQEVRDYYRLLDQTWQQAQRTYERIHKREAHYLSIRSIDYGFSQYYVLFDHAQEKLKGVVCNESVAGAPKPNPVPEEAVWKDTWAEDE